MFSLIAAVDALGGIGRNQTLPWRLRTDMAFFRAVTTGQPLSLPEPLANASFLEALSERYPTTDLGHPAVIMGRKTWDSLPQSYRPLPLRKNLVLSRTKTQFQGAEHRPDLPSALLCVSTHRCFVIGGGALFAEAIGHPDCRRLILTRVDMDFGCDTFFPEIPARFRCVSQSTRFLEPVASDTVLPPTSSTLGFRFELWEC